MKRQFKHFDIIKLDKGDYSLGICLSSKKWNEFRETYLFINLWKWTVSIGRFVG